MNVIRSHLHDVYTEEVNKVALSAEDDKRVIMEDGIHTLAQWSLQPKIRSRAMLVCYRRLIRHK